jgi:hypothetical protein
MRAVLARDVDFRFRARGWSMAPFIRDGDVITVSPLRGALPHKGEVVAFEHPATGSLVVHRVVGRSSGSVTIRGDAALSEADGLIPTENLLGRVTRVERDGRNVRLGLGAERRVVAWLSRARVLSPLVHRFASVRRVRRP